MHILFLISVVFIGYLSKAGCKDVTIESRVEVLEKLLGETMKELKMTKGDILRFKRRAEKRFLMDDEGRPIMFTAQLATHADNLGDNQPVKFDQVVSNNGSGYDPVTGVFTSPSSGNFYFTVTLMCRMQDWVEAHLVVNGISVMPIYAGSSVHFNQGTSSVVVRLNAGDRVWVETFNNIVQGNNIIRVYGGRWSSFTGMRVSI